MYESLLATTTRARIHASVYLASLVLDTCMPQRSIRICPLSLISSLFLPLHFPTLSLLGWIEMLKLTGFNFNVECQAYYVGKINYIQLRDHMTI